MYIPPSVLNVYTHSFVDTHLGCLHLWATTNNAAMNTGVQVTEFLFLILSDTFRWVHLLGHVTTLLCVLEPPNYFPSTPFNVFISKMQFLKIPTNTCYFPHFWLVIIGSLKNYLHVVLTCISLMTNGVEHFSCGSLSFVGCLFNSFAHFRNCIILFVVDLWELFLYSGYKSIVR